MYKRKTRRQQLIQRTLIYTAMTTTVIGLVTVLIFVMLGFRLNRENSFEQGGLVQFASKPAGATVTLGTATLGKKTPSKITAYEGEYNVQMNREGYRTWQKNISVIPGSILWLNYAQLVPETISTERLTQLQDVSQVVVSPNGKQFAIRSSVNTYRIIDVSSDQIEQEELVLPEDFEAPPNARDTIVRWGNDNELLLIKRTLASKVSWLVLDTNNIEGSTNLSAAYGISIKSAQFDPRSSSRIYVQSSDNTIRLLNLSDNTLSAVLANDVREWSIVDDACIVYSTYNEKTDTTSIKYLTLGEAESRIITELNGSSTTYVAGAEYFNDYYIAIAQRQTKQVRAVKLDSLPNSTSDEQLDISPVFIKNIDYMPRYLSVRTGGRFIVVQGSSQLSVYDNELNKFDIVDTKTNLAKEINWLDRYHFYFVNEAGKLQVAEFDGANSYSVADSHRTFDATQTSNSKYIYSFIKADSGYALQRSQMILDS